VAPPPSDAPTASFAIPRFGVDASVVVLGVDENGAMETPEGPWEVAWYDFTARPGFGSNAVFSGHVDARYTGSPGPAVFWNLKDLEQGDRIEVRLADGTVHEYAVISRWSVDADTADVGSIVGPTEKEVVTLITCGGDAGTAYQQRLIVRAERV
jgi:LPXTG-site transpeptidase (sortase) family protein